MKSIIFSLLSILILLTAKPQAPGNNTITGNIKDSVSKQPLEYATITLFVKNSKKPLTGTVTDKAGNFRLGDLPDGIFTIEFEFIGYTPFFMNDIQLNKKNTLANLGSIFLSAQKQNLQAVTVVAQTKLVENKIDKIVFNAEKDVTSQSGVAIDVLKKVPQVSVDAEGNVQLSGSSGVRFLINGKPSTAFGSTIADVLQSIPASEIKSIEVITNPGAKYDAQGLGGIINIILKNNKTKGYNGNLSLSMGTKTENGSFNFNIRNNNFGINAFISGNKRLNVETPSSSVRLTKDSLDVISLHQEGSASLERHSYQSGLNFDWTLKKRNSFSGSLLYNNFGSSTSGTTNQEIHNLDPTIAPVYSLITSNNNFNFTNADASINYKRTFAKEDQELGISINSSFGKDHNVLANDQLALPQDSLFYATNSTNPAKIRETEITADYTQPLKENVLLSIGSKAVFYDVNSASEVLQYQPDKLSFEPDSFLTYDLRYKQQVYAAYSEVSFPVRNWFQTKIGARYERTEIDAFYSNAQQQVNIPGYNTIVPAIFFSKKLTNEQTLKLSYSKRIERPDYEELNPFVNTNDPKNLVAGNPALSPEIGHRVELSYTKEMGKNSIMIGLFYRINNNDIQPYIVYYPSYEVGDTIYTNVTVTTRQNIGTEKNIGINIFANLNITPALTFRMNGLFFRRHTINTIDDGFDYNSLNYRFNINASYQFTKTLVAEFFGNFRSARNEAQGKYPSLTTYNFALRKQFWKQKGSIALTADNFLQEYVTQKTILAGPGFSTSSVRELPIRSFGINFTWKFGKLEFKKNKPENEANTSSQGD